MSLLTSREARIYGGFIDFDDISYDDHADMLYKVDGRVVQRLRSCLSDKQQVLNVLQYHGRTLVDLIHAQMQPLNPNCGN